MRIEPEHIGKILHFNFRFKTFKLEGFEMHGENLYVFGIGDSGARPECPNHPTKQYFMVTNPSDRNNWELVEPDALEGIFDFKKFGCNENYVRDLIKALDERYVRADKK